LKIFVTSDGFLGSYLKKEFKDHLTDDISKADVIINTVGVLNEKKRSFYDSHVQFVKKLTKHSDKKIIHISALGSQKNHKSAYKHTKALGEEIIKNSFSDYAIIKPSLILGDGQKLYEDLEKFKNMPIILVPKMRVQPIEIEKLAGFIKRAVFEDLKGEFELCGEEIISMKRLFKKVFNSFGKNPIIIEAPKWVFKILLPFLKKAGVMTKEEYDLIDDNICKDKNG